MSRRLAALLLFASSAGLAACTSAREGWARRGKYEVLYETSSMQVRRGPQTLDRASGETVLTWVGARTPEGEPELIACELTVYDDRDGDGLPSAGEILSRRESHETSRKILFGDVRSSAPAAHARLVASTASERCEVRWRLAPD